MTMCLHIVNNINMFWNDVKFVNNVRYSKLDRCLRSMLIVIQLLIKIKLHQTIAETIFVVKFKGKEHENNHANPTRHCTIFRSIIKCQVTQRVNIIGGLFFLIIQLICLFSGWIQRTLGYLGKIINVGKTNQEEKRVEEISEIHSILVDYIQFSYEGILLFLSIWNTRKAWKYLLKREYLHIQRTWKIYLQHIALTVLAGVHVWLTRKSLHVYQVYSVENKHCSISDKNMPKNIKI
nr:hypothetical protein 1634Bnrm1_p002 [Cryptomonas sp.]UXY87200.1 hypothetical protein 1634Bnrm1_p161 [Cryptomonas sp.]UXY87203.1 hypothetical protein 1634Bnrm2_p002 [Cryptomonas sp.]UXY87366.1 hypothetical protein 1634Bnrm2_p166 [Cryptomonas sp.]UXY87369.1 hypothetical protein 1634Bnrm3_p002 [Cryptomonas sp.]